MGFTIVLALFWFLPAGAQTTEPPVDDADASISAEVQPVTAEEVAEEPELEGVEIEEPKEVPSGMGLWWKGVKEKVKLATTVNPVKKAELQLKYAEERMRLAKLMAQKADDQKTQVRIHRMIGQAQEMMDKVEARRERLMQENNERGSRLLRNIATHQIRREAVMDKIEEKLPEGAVEKFDELRDKGMVQGRRLLNAINNENAPAETREHLQAIKDRIEAHAEEIKLFRERRVELMDKLKAGGEEVKTEVKEQLKELREERLDKMQERREERKDERVENRQEKLEDIKNGEVVKPLPVNKPGAVIKMKALKQELKNEFKEENAGIKKELEENDDLKPVIVKPLIKNQLAPVGGAVDQTVNSQL